MEILQGEGGPWPPLATTNLRQCAGAPQDVRLEDGPVPVLLPGEEHVGVLGGVELERLAHVRPPHGPRRQRQRLAARRRGGPPPPAAGGAGEHERRQEADEEQEGAHGLFAFAPAPLAAVNRAS